MANPTSFQSMSLSDPARAAISITPSDSTVINPPPRGLYIGVTGDVKVTMLSGDVVTFVGASGQLPVTVTQVWSTNTTATSIVGIY